MSTMIPMIDPNIMRIEFIFDQTPSNFTVEPADLKYDKDFAYSITMDDGYIDAYKNVFSMFYGKIPDLTGRTWSGYTYTDGCGNDVMYNASFGGNLVDINGSDQHSEEQTAYIKWSQYEFGTDFGFDIYFHGWGQPDIFTSNESGYTYDTFLSGVTQSSEKYYEKIGKRHLVGTRPNGVNSYVNIDNKCPLFDGGIKSFGADVGSSIIVAGETRQIDTIGVRVDNITNEMFNDGIIFNRPQMDSIEGTGTTISNINTAANDAYKRWVTNFTHRIKYSEPSSGSLTVDDFEKILNYIDSNYGKNGLDNVWVCGVQEMIEYIHCKLNTIITTSFEGRKAIVQVEYPTGSTYLNDIRRPALTLKFNCNNSPTQINTYNVVKYSNNIIGNNSGIINLEWSNEFEIVANKYVTIAENTRLQTDVDFAQFLINRVVDYDIRNPLQTRLNNIIVIVTITYLIDFGALASSYTTGPTGVPPTTDKTWNNFYTIGNVAPYTGLTLNLVDTNNISSTKSITVFSGFTGIGQNGSSITGGTYPYTAYRDSFTCTSPAWLLISGLTSGSTYTIKIMGSRGLGVSNVTKYTVNNISQNLTTTDNVINTSDFTNITLNENNQIYIKVEYVSGSSAYGILSCMEIIEN